MPVQINMIVAWSPSVNILRQFSKATIRIPIASFLRNFIIVQTTVKDDEIVIELKYNIKYN